MKTLMVILLLTTISLGEIGDTAQVVPADPELSTSRAATSESTTDNGDGTFTYTQWVDGTSTAPHYTPPANGGGFGIYGWKDQDFGWMHDFDDYNQAGLTITEAKLVIRAYDVDSEPIHGENGEYDGISVDGVDLDPGLLQGTNNTWSTTTFDVPLSALSDGVMTCFIDIDMNEKGWATDLRYSELQVTYTFLENNSAPYEPQLAGTSDATGLTVTVTGPTPADPDGDVVTFTYRWFVDVGQGFFVDDEFGGRGDHTGNFVPAEDLVNGDIWRCQVTPQDEQGALGNAATFTFPEITDDADGDGVSDSLDSFPEDSERAFLVFYPSEGNYNTFAFEDLWPYKGDYDMNDVVVYFNYRLVKNSSNDVKDIRLTYQLAARGAGGTNELAFALQIPGTNGYATSSVTNSIDGTSVSVEVESDNGGIVFRVVENVHTVLPVGNGSPYFNTENYDVRSVIPGELNITFATPVPEEQLGDLPFNPFIYRTSDRGYEIHLRGMEPTGSVTNALLGSGHDNSLNGMYYATVNNLPFALELNGVWRYPEEKAPIISAYPELSDWVQSGGTTNSDWSLEQNGNSQLLWNR